MAVIALTSASGSPGVTTTALGMALLWPRPVLLVEADPTGGSGLLAGYFRGTREYDGGLIELALTSSSIQRRRSPRSSERIEGTTSRSSPAPGRTPRPRPCGICGSRSPRHCADLESTGQDVIVDAGRLGLVGSPEPLLDAADLTLLVTRSDAAGHLGGALVGGLGPAAAPSTGNSPACCSSARVSRTAPAKWPGCSACPWSPPSPDDSESAAVFSRGAQPPRSSRPGRSPVASTPRSPSIHATVSRRRTELLEGARP